MKKLVLLATILGSNLAAFSQNTVKQYFYTSGGKYLSGGTNKVKVAAIDKNWENKAIDSIIGDFSNAVAIYYDKPNLRYEGLAHIGRSAGNDLIVRYDLDTYKVIDSTTSSGVVAFARNKEKLVVAKGNGYSGTKVDILNAQTLQFITGLTEITNNCTDVKIFGDSAYVSHSTPGSINPCAGYGYDCRADSVGHLSIINLKTNTIANTIELGTKGAGIGHLFIVEGEDGRQHIYFTNLKDSLFKIVDNSVVHSVAYSTVLAVTNDYIYGLKNTGPNLTAIRIDKSTDALEANPTSLDSTNFAYGLYANYDTVNNKYLVFLPDYAKDGYLVRFAVGQKPDSINVGISTTALAIDYRPDVLSGILSNAVYSKSNNVYPNPCKDVLTILNSNNASTWQINNLQGQTIANGNMNSIEERINTEDLAKGVYYLVTRGNTIVGTTKFVKE